ncbi:MAG: hypothetical protein D6723_04145, partial [Acidobacteria bacterium]
MLPLRHSIENEAVQDGSLRSAMFEGVVHGLASHTEGMNIKPQIAPMVTDEEKNRSPSVESVAIFEGVVHGAPAPHRGNEKSLLEDLCVL